MTNGKFRAAAALVVAGSLLAGCSSLPGMSSLNPFKSKEEVLPGERVTVLDTRAELAPSAAAAKIAVVVPPVAGGGDWTQPGGDAANAPGNIAYSGALREAWSADAGTGSSSEGRLTARPIVHGGRVYTLDTRGTVSAFTASGGSTAWSLSLRPENEETSEGYGGGLAIADGRLYAATGYGTMVALDPSSGKSLWSKSLNVPIRTSPTAADGKVFIVTTEGRLYCLSGADGEEVWTQRGIPDQTAILNNNSPAVSGNAVVVPFSSGDINAYDIKTGRQIWSDSLSSARSNSIISAVANPGRPAVAGGVVYAVGNAGRMVATSQKDGERLWNLTLASTQTPWPAGNMVYVVDNNGRAVALSRSDGTVVWVRQLPETGLWNGPVLAGDKLWLVSVSGKLVGLNPQNGEIATQKDIDSRIHIAPVVAAGHMYIFTDSAKLIALN